MEDAIKKMGFNTFSILDASRSLRQVFRCLYAFLGIFGSLALTVASIGIVNTLVMAILERRREIGIMKAIGASDGDVKKLFFAEAGAMGILGGIVGVALGWAIGQVINFGTNIYLKSQSLPPEHFWAVPWWLVVLRSFLRSWSAWFPASIPPDAPPGSIPCRRCATSKLTRMIRALRLVCLSSSSSLAGSAAAQSRIDCNALNSQILKQSVHYCVYLPSGYDAGATQKPPQRYPVLYFLHGLGDNEQTLFNSGGWTLLDDLRRQHKMGDFLIVAPEGRRSFYINSADGSVRYSDFLSAGVSPSDREQISHPPGPRGARHQRHFHGWLWRVAFRFRASGTVFGSERAERRADHRVPAELDAASRVRRALAGVLAAVFGNPINVAHWNENSPFVLAKKKCGRACEKLAIYFNCGQDDNYGFEKGAAALHEELQKEGVKHEYHAYPGDHSLTYFLSHFAEVMEFHSKAFGLLPTRPSSPDLRRSCCKLAKAGPIVAVRLDRSHPERWPSG